MCLLQVAKGPLPVRLATPQRPAISGRSVPHRFYTSPEYVEVDMDVSKDPTAARALKLVKPASKLLVVTRGGVPNSRRRRPARHALHATPCLPQPARHGQELERFGRTNPAGGRSTWASYSRARRSRNCPKWYSAPRGSTTLILATHASRCSTQRASNAELAKIGRYRISDQGDGCRDKKK